MKSFMKSKEENNQQDLFEHRIRLNKGLAWRGAQQRIWVNKGRPIKTEGNYQAKVVNKHVKNLSCQEVVSVPPVRSSRASNGQKGKGQNSNGDSTFLTDATSFGLETRNSKSHLCEDRVGQATESNSSCGKIRPQHVLASTDQCVYA